LRREIGTPEMTGTVCPSMEAVYQVVFDKAATGQNYAAIYFTA